MNYLFIHQNYPGQFKHLAPAMAALPGNQVIAVVDETNRRPASLQPNVQLVSYPAPTGASKETHWYLKSYESAIRRGQHVARLAMELKKRGFKPDVICAHAGWGEALFLRNIFPQAVIVGYFEFFYRSHGSDMGFDNEFHAPTLDDYCRLDVRNSTHLLTLQNCDWGLAPTQWQVSQFPDIYRSRISVIHEGVDTDLVRPKEDAEFAVDGVVLSSKDQVVTFVNRNLEPYRGFHIFMRAIPQIQAENPNAHIVIVGGDEVSYGRLPEEGGNWREKMLKELHGRIDLSRVHFVGKIAYERYLNLLQISSAHVYLTYPFVLSWSLLEAMAAGCVVIASRTAPVTEVIRDGQDGLLVDFFDVAGFASAVSKVLANPAQYQSLRERARQSIVERYDLQKVCLPQQVQLLQKLAPKAA